MNKYVNFGSECTLNALQVCMGKTKDPWLLRKCIDKRQRKFWRSTIHSLIIHIFKKKVWFVVCSWLKLLQRLHQRSYCSASSIDFFCLSSLLLPCQTLSIWLFLSCSGKLLWSGLCGECHSSLSTALPRELQLQKHRDVSLQEGLLSARLLRPHLSVKWLLG